MGTIHTGGQPLDEKGTMVMPAMEIPSFRTYLAKDRGHKDDILLFLRGGLGDVVCALPSVMYALAVFRRCSPHVRISVATEFPELFKHLPLKRIYDLNVQEPKWNKYFVFRSFADPDEFVNEFMMPLGMNIVDYISIKMFRVQLPHYRKNIMLPIGDFQIALPEVQARLPSTVVIHPGRTWQSRTIPVDYWNQIIDAVHSLGRQIILIGGGDSERGTVNVDSSKCIDLREKLDLLSTVSLLDKCEKLLTNESAPMHLAAATKIQIGFFATVKHESNLLHWRNINKNRPDMPIENSFGFFMENLATGGLWQELDWCPNNMEKVTVNEVGDEKLRSYLPSIQKVLDFVI